MSSLQARFSSRLNQLMRDGSLTRYVAALSKATHSRLRHPLLIRGYDTAGNTVALPNKPSCYKNARFCVNAVRCEAGGPIFHEGVYGYNLPQEFRRIGPFEHIQLNEHGDVIVASFRSAENMLDFQYHLLGRLLSKQRAERIVYIQEVVFAHLRDNEACMSALADFALKRGWPTGLADEAKLAYFHPKYVDLHAFAESQGITDEEMWLTGWFEKTISKTGDVQYSVRDADVVRIPYFHNGRIETWRTRNLRDTRAKAHKYTSWPLNRSIQNWSRLEHRLYNSWRLSEARGKRLVITEGEFKCHVATHFGQLTVGIPGITEVDDETILVLVNAGASEYIVVLDRDPIGKGLMRVDGITDSQRAAYFIAIRLIEAGAQNVRIGHIPDVRDGDKVGLDDLILDCGAQAMFDMLNSAMLPQTYADMLGMSTTFCRIIRARQVLRKALEHYAMSTQRGGTQVSAALYKNAHELFLNIDTLYHDFLTEVFLGARRIDQPEMSLISLYRSSYGVPQPEAKLVLSHDGRELPIALFSGDILGLNFAPKDAPRKNLFVLGSTQWLPVTAYDLQRLRRQPESLPAYIHQLMARGAQALDLDPERAVRGKYPQRTLAAIAAASRLDYWFPADEYTIERNISLMVCHEKYWEVLATIPIAVFHKSSGNAVAIANVAMWQQHSESALALDAAYQSSSMAMWFFRRRHSKNATERFRLVAKTLWPYWFDRNRKATEKALGRFGVTAETIGREQPVFLSRKDQAELLQHFRHRRLINQAAQAGLMLRLSSGLVVRRFTDSIVVLPIRNAKGEVCALRVLPYNPLDHLPPALPPEPRIVRHLYGTGKYLMSEFDPLQFMYLQDRLPTNPGQCVIVTYHELDALALTAADTPVVALNSSFKLDTRAVKRLAASAPATICFVISSDIPTSPYDAFAYDGVPGFMKELHDLTTDINEALSEDTITPHYRVIVTPEPLVHAVAQKGAQACIKELLDKAVSIPGFMRINDFNATQHHTVRQFLRVNFRLMDYLELLAFPDLLDARPIDWWVRESKRLYRAIQIYAQSKHGVTIEPIEEYVRQLLHLKTPLELDELVRLRQTEGRTFRWRRIYRHRRGTTRHLPKAFSATMSRIMSPTIATTGISNELRGPKFTQIDSTQTQGDAMAHTKSLVLEYLTQQLKTTPQVQPHFEQNKEGFFCRILVRLGNNTYVGTGQAGRKKPAETSAYGIVLRKMVDDGHEVKGAQQALAAIASEAEVAATAQPNADTSPVPTVSPKIERALAHLRMNPGNNNYVGCLNQFVQTAGLPPVDYTVMPAIGSDGTIGFTTTAVLTLEAKSRTENDAKNPVTIQSETMFDVTKKGGKQQAANSLIALIWHHFE